MLEKSSSKFRQCYGIIDDHIENVLSRLHDEPIKDVSEDMMVLCSTEELRETRDKLFGMAKKKVHGDDVGGDISTPIMPGMKSITDPWGLVSRRSKKRLDEDVCKLYLFVVRDGYKFPYKILKRGTLKENGNQMGIREALRSAPGELKVHKALIAPSRHSRDAVDNSECDKHNGDMPAADTPPPSENVAEDAPHEHGRMDTSASSSIIETLGDVQAAEYDDEPTDVSSLSDQSDLSSDESEDTDSESTIEPPADECEGATSRPVIVVPAVVVTPPLSDIGVQCDLLDAPALRLIPKKDSPGQKLRHIVEEMARNHEESWDDLIEAEQIVNQHDSEEEMEPAPNPPIAIQDPVGRDEFEGHVEFQDRALSEHEGRINALEMATNQFDHRVDVVDAVLSEKMRLLRIRQEDADGEMLKVRHFITTFLDQASMHNKQRALRNASVAGQATSTPAATGEDNHAPNNCQYDLPAPLQQRESSTARNNARQRSNNQQSAPPRDQPKLTPGVIYSTPKPTSSEAAAKPPQAKKGESYGPKPRGRKGKMTESDQMIIDLAIEPPASRSSAVGDPDAPVDRERRDNGATGARPKSSNQGKVDFTSNNDVAKQTGESESSVSYADAAGKYPWQTPDKRKRKRDTSGPTQAKKPVLKGVSNKGNRELSVLGLSNDGFKDLIDIEEAVRAYCHERDVDLVFIKVFRKKHELNTVGCKIAVRAPDAPKVTGYDFWPEDVYARKWHRGNKSANGEEDRATSPKRD